MPGERLFALDQNFPTPIVATLARYQSDAELVPVAAIDPRLAGLDDWELLLALHHHGRPWDGLITTDSSMTKQPRELAALIQTGLTLVVAEDAGHHPVKAAGLVLAHLAGICRRTHVGTPQLWRLRASERSAESPWDRFASVARHRGETTGDLWRDARLTSAELARDPLA